MYELRGGRLLYLLSTSIHTILRRLDKRSTVTAVDTPWLPKQTYLVRRKPNRREAKKSKRGSRTNVLARIHRR